jgi:hypothetical protein
MPDITMCPGGDCPLKETCYRYKAEPSDYQSYWFEPPYYAGICEHYWEIETHESNT